MLVLFIYPWPFYNLVFLLDLQADEVNTRGCIVSLRQAEIAIEAEAKAEIKSYILLQI